MLLPDERRAWRTPHALIWPAVAAGLTLAWALPVTVRFVVDAPPAFWAMAIAALIVDVPLFGLARRDDPALPVSHSIGFTFAIFWLWGAGPAIVVAATAITVASVGQRCRPGAGVLLAARTICGAVAAGTVLLALGLPPARRGGVLDGHELVAAVSAGGVWFVVSYAVLVAVRVAGRPDGLTQAARELRPDALRTATCVLLVTPILGTVRGWWPLVVAVPVLGWNLLLRDHLREQERLRREPDTGLLNRRGLMAGMRALVAPEHVPAPSARPFAVILLNVESVLEITSSVGRDVSEEVSRAASRRLVKQYGDDRVGQWSGESFVLLIPDVTEEAAVAEAERASELLARPIEVGDIPFLLDPVAGVAMSPEHGSEIGTLLMKSGLAADGARRQGRRVLLYVRQAAAVTRRRIDILSQFNLALREPDRHGEIAVVYQPQVDLATGALVGAEALLRWTHPRLGPVPTNEVIEAVESSQVMRLLTRHVLESVAGQLHRWNEQGRYVRASVNVSVQDLHDPGFAAELGEVLGTRGVAPAQIVIEITERMILDDARTAQAVEELTTLGVGLSLDDFGTGHASLQQLRRLPLTEVKIDQSYVRGMVENPADLAIVTSVHQLASALGVAVVAEGVEDQVTAAALAGFTGTVGQGYYFGRPGSADALSSWPRVPVPRMAV